MQQPIKKEVLDNGIKIKEDPFYTLLLDGTSLLKVCMADPTLNENGKLVGPIFQFLLQVKILMNKRNFKHCYCFWDCSLSGLLRYNCYSDYKKNRDKSYSEYDQQLKAFTKKVLSYSEKTDKQNKIDNERKQFEELKLVLHLILEELYVRQVWDEEGTEADDLIAYYCLNKLPNEKIYIISRDNDLTQLIDENICIYQPTEKLFLHKGNFQQIKGIPVENVVLKKILTGDVSDNIKGIKGLGEKTLYELFPDIKKKPITLDYIFDTAKLINEQRLQNKPKQKPLSVCDNILNKVTDGVQGNEVYEINEKIINLKNPLLTNSIKEEMDNLIHIPIDPEGRSMENLYQIIVNNKIQDLMGNKFSIFFSTYKKLIDNELLFFNENI